MNTKNVLITLGIVAAVGTAGFFAYKYYKAKQTTTTPPPTNNTGQQSGAAGTNANQNQWLSTIGGLFGDLGHIFTGNSTSPTNNTTTTTPVVSDNSGTTTSLDDLGAYFA